MSIKVMNAVWANADCSGSELLILLALADFSDDNGENIYPSMQTLARKSRMSDKQARRVVQNLVKLKLIEIVEAGGWQRGRNRSNSYRILLENIGTPNLGVPLSHPREDSTPAGDSTVLPRVGDDPSFNHYNKPPLKKMRPAHGRIQKRSYHPEDYDDL